MDGDFRYIKKLPRYNSIHTSPDARFNGRNVYEKLQPETEYKRDVDLDEHGQIDRRLSGNDFPTQVQDSSARKVCSEED